MTIGLILVLGAIVVILFFQMRELGERIKQSDQRLDELEFRLHQLQRSDRTESPAKPAEPTPLPSALLAAQQPAPAAASKPPEVPPAPGAATGAVPPPLPPIIEPVTAPPTPARVHPVYASTPVPERRGVNWEQFLGVKLFAWIGGLILFLGVAFFLKYSFDQGWIDPPVRVALGYLTGIGLIVGGLFIPRERYAVTVQTLCAAGTLILYANIFASFRFYSLVGQGMAFGLMALVTVTAFFLAVRLDAQVVAVLGLLGGFLTPVLLSTGQDHPVALFSYIAVLDAGLLAVALRKRWNHLVLLAAVATAFMQVGWVGQFFEVEKINTALTIFLGFAALFTAAFWVANRIQAEGRFSDAAALLMPGAALLFVLYLLVRPYPTLADRVWLLFGFVFLIDLAYLLMAWRRDDLRLAINGGGAIVFVLLTVWTAQFLADKTLNAALAFFLLFALFHSVVPVVLQRMRPVTSALWWIHLWPPLALLLMMIPIFKLAEPSILIWPVVLLVDVLAIGLAILTASLVSIVAVFLLTMLATALWIIKLPPEIPEVPSLLVVIGGFAVFFMAAAVFAARKLVAPAADRESESGGQSPVGLPALTPGMFSHIAALGAVLPFLLLTLVVLRMPMDNPSSVFGLAALLIVLLLALVRLYAVDLLALVGLVSVLLLEYTWHLRRFAPEQGMLAMGWYLGFSLVFLVFPFLFRQQLESRVMPWIAAALALPAHFTVLYRTVNQTWPKLDYLGLLPALLAVPCLLALVQLVRSVPAERASRNTLLALFGGATLFFVTLVFPIQFERQWLTIGWALEGVALVWLFHRIPHPGLRVVGAALLVVAFVRLALNPAVLEYHARSGTPIFNWFLYAYGIVTVCLLLGAWLLSPPRNQVFGLNAPPLLYSLGTVLAFLLLNIEIADYFSTGTHLTFEFSGNLARDMTYSLAWGLFAFLLLAIGFKLRKSAARFAGMGLLVITLVKLFLHDLWRLGDLYRVGSLVGLAVVLIVASFFYQRFLSSAALKKADQERPQPGNAGDPSPSERIP